MAHEAELRSEMIGRLPTFCVWVPLLLVSALAFSVAIWLGIAVRGQFDEIALKVDNQQRKLVEVSRQPEPLSSEPVHY